MFIYNFKINNRVIYRIILIAIILFVLILCGIVSYKIYSSSIRVNDNLPNKDYIEITNENYATILKTVHDNIDEYIGQKIKYSGFVYRVYDLNRTQFVLGRNMLISSDYKTVVIGFLCNYNEANKLKDYAWVEIEGTIFKGIYHGDMPILEIYSLKEIQKPNNEYVYPPNEDYIPTSKIL